MVDVFNAKAIDSIAKTRFIEARKTAIENVITTVNQELQYVSLEDYNKLKAQYDELKSQKTEGVENVSNV